MDSRFKPALVRVKVPELEGMNYEAYTISMKFLIKMEIQLTEQIELSKVVASL